MDIYAAVSCKYWRAHTRICTDYQLCGWGRRGLTKGKRAHSATNKCISVYTHINDTHRALSTHQCVRQHGEAHKSGMHACTEAPHKCRSIPATCTWHRSAAAWRSCLCTVHRQWASAGVGSGSGAPGCAHTDQQLQPSPAFCAMSLHCDDVAEKHGCGSVISRD